MSDQSSSLSSRTPEQITQIKQWVATWKRAGEELERIRQEELRNIDNAQAIALLCYDADHTKPPHAPKPTSWLVEMQARFMKMRKA